MTRPQFRLSTLLWITLAVACWFGGMRAERWLAEIPRYPPSKTVPMPPSIVKEAAALLKAKSRQP